MSATQAAGARTANVGPTSAAREPAPDSTNRMESRSVQTQSSSVTGGAIVRGHPTNAVCGAARDSSGRMERRSVQTQTIPLPGEIHSSRLKVLEEHVERLSE